MCVCVHACVCVCVLILPCVCACTPVLEVTRGSARSAAEGGLTPTVMRDLVAAQAAMGRGDDDSPDPDYVDKEKSELEEFEKLTQRVLLNPKDYVVRCLACP